MIESMQVDGLTIDESVIDEAQRESGPKMRHFTDLQVVDAKTVEESVVKADTIVCPGCGRFGVREQAEMEIPELPDNRAWYCADCHLVLVAEEDVDLGDHRRIIFQHGGTP